MQIDIKDKSLPGFIKALKQMHANRSRVDDGFIEYQFNVFESVIHWLVKDEGLVFNTLFSKISYVGLKYDIDKELVFDMHLYRKEYDKNLPQLSKSVFFRLGLYLIYQLLKLGSESLGGGLKASDFPRPVFKIQKKTLQGRKLYGRYSLTGKNEDGSYTLIDEQHPESELTMRTDNLEVFRTSIEYMDARIEEGALPLSIALVYIDIDVQGILLPAILVIEPDFLVDVTAIAECFKPTGANAGYYLINKFLLKPKSKYITIGNIVNWFLDELMNNPGLEFKDVVKEIFYLDPLMFAMMDDVELKEIVATLKLHFNNLKRSINEDFEKLYLDRTKCYLEPSFFSPVFGLQGRLDVFHKDIDSNDAAIVELKSGKLFRANTYGLNTNHYTQTLLYEMLVRSVFDFKVKSVNYILYSVLEENNIRFAPTIAAQQREAIAVRNEIVIQEKQLYKPQNGFFDFFSLNRYPAASGFFKRDLGNIQMLFEKMTALDKTYFLHFSSFIVREHHLAKTGFAGKEGGSSGQSALWLLSDKQKVEHFSILKNMEVTDTGSGEDVFTIDLSYSPKTNKLANFRKGDIVLIYPAEAKKDVIIQSQIFKCTILDISGEKIRVRLRNKLYNKELFSAYRYWNIEHDFLDSGFTKMFRSLTRFFTYDRHKKDLILSLEPPARSGEDAPVVEDEDLTPHQKETVRRILKAKDYFILWGPPGTGKTSKIVKSSVKHLVENGKSVMLLAYTNRAVDELCAAIESISPDMKANYIRIGSRFSSDPAYMENLFDNKIKSITNRSELKALIDNTRIFVSTVSSLQSKHELFELKKFDVLIVDEASQLLEPMLVSILPQFDKFVLVGDHRQLPAVVVQPPSMTQTVDRHLHSIGLHNLSNSLFERLLNRAKASGWHWAYSMLDEQGRMHEDIMKFANEVFYESKLKAIDSLKRLKEKRNLDYKNKLQKILARNRMIYVPSAVNEAMVLSKVNPDEAKKIAVIVDEIFDVYKNNGLEVKEDTLGIITTFRAQIARIKHELEKRGVDTSKITIDTVERYQGSARDIIIYSMSINSTNRLENIISPDENGVDRKLNVVVTRARQQFILLGNKDIISSNDLYSKLISYCQILSL